MKSVRDRLRWPMIARLLLIVGSIGVFLAAGQLAANQLIRSQQQRQLEELGGLALRRSETAVEYGVAALRDFAAQGNVGCEAGALQSVRLYVYRSGALKDIRVVQPDAAVICSAFSETLEFDKGWVSRSDMLPTVSGDAMLFRVEQFFGTALGAMIDVNSNYSLAGILGMDGSLLDIMPAELRDNSSVSLELDNGQTIAQTASAQSIAENGLYTRSFASTRYPLRIVIGVERAALAAWNRQPYLPTMLIFGLLGAVFGPLLSRALLRPRTPLQELDRAISLGQIQPYYQPIFDLRTSRIVGAELLARWVRPDGTVIPPARFIELAEETGRIPALTWQLLATALAEMQALLHADKDFKLSVNISPSHFVSQGFVKQLRQAVSRANVAAHQITLELTERESFADPDQAAITVAEVHGLGFKVAIDDVGIGHSGLSQIQRLRADILKIDKFFIDSVNLDSSSTTMIDMLVRLADEMKMSIVAEGIEQPEQVEALIACGIANGQGYVVSPPIAAGPFLEFMATHVTGQAAGTAATPRAA